MSEKELWYKVLSSIKNCKYFKVKIEEGFIYLKYLFVKRQNSSAMLITVTTQRLSNIIFMNQVKETLLYLVGSWVF